MTKGNVRKGVECGGLPDFKGKVIGWSTAEIIPSVAVGAPPSDEVKQGWSKDPTIPDMDFDIGNMKPWTIRFVGCKEVIFRVGEIEVKIDFYEDRLDKIDAIIINGHKFVRNGGERE